MHYQTNFFYAYMQWYVATLSNEYSTSCVFKHNTWCVGILLDVCVK
jgi:hypothetical protein